MEPTIDIIYEQENNNTLLFMDILQINNNDKLEFKVYRNSTNKNEIYIFTHIIIKWNNHRLLQ